MRALADTKTRHYHGVDLSESALKLAANNLKDMPFEVELDHGDFVEAITRRPEHADVAWSRGAACRSITLTRTASFA